MKYLKQEAEMYWSKSFIPTSKENPSGAKIPSHQLLIRAGMIKQESAGIYSWLPMGFKVLKKIEEIVREEQKAAGAIEVLMPTLQSSELWIESGRYDGYGEEMLRISDRHDANLIYGPTNEEQITEIFRTYVKSYKKVHISIAITMAVEGFYPKNSAGYTIASFSSFNQALPLVTLVISMIASSIGMTKFFLQGPLPILPKDSPVNGLISLPFIFTLLINSMYGIRLICIESSFFSAYRYQQGYNEYKAIEPIITPKKTRPVHI